MVCFEKGSPMVNTHHIDDDKTGFYLKNECKMHVGLGEDEMEQTASATDSDKIASSLTLI